MGSPVEYDVFQYIHQVPGGMITNLEFMLSQRGMEDRLEEVLEEVSIIREEWGYPVIITPFSQLVGTQAVLNVLLGERYKVATEEAIRYVLGHYGRPPAPVDQNALDKITGLPEARELLDWEQPQPFIEELRKEVGRSIKILESSKTTKESRQTQGFIPRKIFFLLNNSEKNIRNSSTSLKYVSSLGNHRS